MYLKANNSIYQHQSSFKVWMELINNGMVQLPALLFRNYSVLSINEEQMMLLIHIHIFQTIEHNDFPTINQLEERMSINHQQIMIHLQSLMKSGLLSIDEHMNNGIRSEVYNFEPLYFKLYQMVTTDREVEPVQSQSLLEKLQSRDVFTAFEQEFGRPLSPLECESLTMWLDQDGIPEDLVISALREAVFAGKLSFRYIDRILFEWQRNNVKTIEDAKKHAAQFRSNASQSRASGQNNDSKTHFKIFNWLDDSKTK